MFSAIIQSFFVSFIVAAIAQADGIVSTSASSTMTVSQAGYPPRGLLDSINSMRIREELYQSELREGVAHQLVVDPEFSLSIPNPIASGILTSIQSIEGVYRSLLLSDIDGQTTNTSCPTITSSYTIPATTIAPTILPSLQVQPPEITNYTMPQMSNAAQPHILISIVWVLVISFIIGMTLYTALDGLGSFILLFLALNVICAVIVGAQADPEPRRRPIGGLRPGPIGKVPCGPVRGTIGTKQGHGFVHGVDRKVGGLRPVIEELVCDDWSNAKSLFGRGMAIPTIMADEVEKTTTIYTTMETTVWVTVEDTATQTQKMTSRCPSPTSFKTPASTITTITKPTPSFISLGDLAKIEQESSAPPPAVNIRASASKIFLLYLVGVFLCLLAGGTPGALSYVIISLAIIAIIGGAEAVAIPDPIGLHSAMGWRVAGLKPAGVAKVRDSSEVTVWNGIHTITGSVEGARLRDICGEVYCHNWPSTENETPIPTASKPTPTYADLAKRLPTEYITVTPTSGIIGIFGPQIIPVTVESTAYENVIVSTIDIERVRSTRTKVVTVFAPETTAPGILTMSKTDGMGGFRMTTLTAMPSDEVRTTIGSSPAEETSTEGQIEGPTVFVTTTASTLPASTVFVTTTVIASRSSSPSSSYDPPSSSPTTELRSETPSPTNLPATSSASHLDPTQLYLSFVEINLYCFLLLFIGLQIALTMSHHLLFLGSMALLMVGGAAAMQMCAREQGLLSGVY